MFISLMTESVSAGIQGPVGIEKISQELAHTIDTKDWKDWLKTQSTHLADTLRTVTTRRYNRDENRTYRAEIIAYAENIFADIKSGKYTWNITSAERKLSEDFVLSFQKDFAKAIQDELDRQYQKWGKISGDMHFTMRSGDIDLDIDVDTYKVSVSHDYEHMEFDTRVRVSAREKTIPDSFSVMVDGNIKIIKNDLYVTLRDYSITLPKVWEEDTEEYSRILKELRGKTYHQKIEHEYGNLLAQNKVSQEESMKLMNEALTILRTESLLTPVAKNKDIYILALKVDTLKKFASIINESEDILPYEVQSLPLPMMVATDNKNIFLEGMNANVRWSGNISRTSSNIVLMKIDALEKWTSDPWKMQFAKTPTNWILGMASSGYTVDVSATETKMNWSIKKWSKTIATLTVDSNGIDAWTYNMSAIWEDISYNYETWDSESEDITVRLWGNIKQEFWDFKLTPPTIYEELENSLYRKMERSQGFISDLESIWYWLDYHNSRYGRYPTAPKNWCVTSIKVPRNFYTTFDYYAPKDGLSTATCPTGYYYRPTRDASGNLVYIVATRVEVAELANYDASTLDITRASYEQIQSHITLSGVTSTNPQSWYYVHTDISTDSTAY